MRTVSFFVVDEANKLSEAAALPPDLETDTSDLPIEGATINGDVLAGDAPIDENLFDGDDLDIVEEELETLELCD